MNISNKYLLLIFISFILFSILIYLPSLSGHFIHDDRPNLVYNDAVQIKTLNIESLSSAATSSGSGALGRPVSMVSFALNYYFFGDEPLSFKLTNVVLHALTGVLVFILIYKIYNLHKPTKRKQSIFWFAAIAAVLWLVHPLQVSTVAYIVQRMAILSTMFSLIAILFFIIGRCKIINNNAQQSWQYFILCGISILLGVYSKENAILTPIFIILIEALIFYPQTKSNFYKKISKVTFYSVIFTTTLALLLFYSEIYIFLDNWYYTTREFSLAERLYTQGRIIIHYINWLLVPNIQELGLFHDDIALSESLTSPITTLFSIITISLLIIVTILARKKLPLVTLGFGWFIIGHLLESTIIPLEMIYEHRNYLPSIGLIICIASIFAHIIDKQEKLYLLAPYLVVSTIIILSILTYSRATQWSNPINFAFFEVQHHPESLRANHTLGMEYKGLVEAGNIEYKNKAYKYLEKASELGKKRLFSEAALIALADNLGESAKPIWIDRMAFKLSNPVPRIDDIYLLKSITDCNKDSCILPVDAAELLFDSLGSNPRLNIDKISHSKYHSTRANFIMQRRLDISQAEHHFKRAIEIWPENIQNYADYINMLIMMNRHDEASIILERAKEKNAFSQNIPRLNALRDIIQNNP